MKTFFDYIPVLAFFSAYFLSGQDLMFATWAIIIACGCQVVLGRLVFKQFDKMYLGIFAITLVFGGMALLFRDDTFIKWRDSITSFTMAAVLFGGQFMQRNLIERLVNAFAERSFGFPFHLSKTDWRLINLICVIFFIACGLINLYIAFYFSTNFWVNFNLFGFIGINLVFFAGLMYFIYKRLPEEDRKRLNEVDSKTREKN